MRPPSPRAAQQHNQTRPGNGDLNKLYQEDRQVHDWYKFVFSFPPHLVRDYLERFGVDERHLALDPFCGARFMVRVTLSGGRASWRAATPVGNRRLSRSFALPDCYPIYLR